MLERGPRASLTEVTDFQWGRKDLDLTHPDDQAWLVAAFRREDRQFFLQRVLRELVFSLPIFKDCQLTHKEIRKYIRKARLRRLEEGKQMTKETVAGKWFGVVVKGQAVNLYSRSQAEWASSDTQARALLLQNKFAIERGQPQKLESFEVIGSRKVVFKPLQTLTSSLIISFAADFPLPTYLQSKPALARFLNERLTLLPQIQKVNFVRGNSLEGSVFFVLSGEVQTAGRMVARGWVVRGQARGEGVALKIKQQVFYRYFIQHQQTFEQFIRDLTFNQTPPLEREVPRRERKGDSLEDSLRKEQARGKLPTLCLSAEQRKEVQRYKHRNVRIEQHTGRWRAMSRPVQRPYQVDSWMLGIYVKQP